MKFPEVNKEFIVKFNEVIEIDSFPLSAKVEQTEEGANITITDKTGTTTATIKHGADGNTPQKGTDYFTEADKAEFVEEVLGSIPGGGNGGTVDLSEIEADIDSLQEDVSKLSEDISDLKENGSGGGASLDVQINGTSIVEDGVANIPVSYANKLGVVKNYFNQFTSGIKFESDGSIRLFTDKASLESRNANYAITNTNLDYAVKTAMCDGKGAEWTSEEKASARERIGVDKALKVIDIEVTEEIKRIELKQIDGVNIEELELTQMWLLIENVGDSTCSGTASEVAVQLNNKLVVSMANTFINNKSKQYASGIVDVKNGLAFSIAPSNQPTWRGAVTIPQNCYELVLDGKINSLYIQSNVTNFPIGTKIKVVLR